MYADEFQQAEYIIGMLTGLQVRRANREAQEQDSRTTGRED